VLFDKGGGPAFLPPSATIVANRLLFIKSGFDKGKVIFNAYSFSS
jgi:hypothetical protein